MNSTMSSSLAAGATAPISTHFSVTSEAQLILPTSIYLVGYAGGPMIWGPISESYGRKWTITAAFVVFTIFSIASAVSPNFAALVVFRLLVGVGGSCAISVVGGICADVYHDPVSRGRSMAIFMVCVCPRRAWVCVLMMSTGCDNLWPYSRSSHLRLHQCRLLELGFLDRRNLCSGHMAALLLLP